MNNDQLPAATHIGDAHFIVADMKRALDFYVDKLGFSPLRQEGNQAVLSADGVTPQILLTEQRGAGVKPQRSTGLYHVAIRFPDRTSLARAFRRLISVRYPFGGFSDHTVSEALYLSDPDGNGLEMYVDRPRETWTFQDGQVVMATDPLDVDDLLAQADNDLSAWNGVDPKTDIGHVHLHVSDLQKAKAFYVDLLGLDIVLDFSTHGALFVSAGGYHHHIGLNIWAGKTPPPPNVVGLRSFQLIIPDEAALDEVIARLEKAGVAVERLASGGVLAHDFDSNAVELTTAQTV
ncbi:MAG: VOC family protein [Chloroflexota bacterium]